MFTRANAVWIYTDFTLVYTLGNSKVENTVFTLVITLVKSRVEEKSHFLGWFSPEDQKNVPHSNMCVIIYSVTRVIFAMHWSILHDLAFFQNSPFGLKFLDLPWFYPGFYPGFTLVRFILPWFYPGVYPGIYQGVYQGKCR